MMTQKTGAAFVCGLLLGLGAAGLGLATRLGPTAAEAATPEAADKTLGMALMSAVVSLSGNLERGAGATGAERLDEGTYNVTFNRSIKNCTSVVSLGDPIFSDWTPSIFQAHRVQGAAKTVRVVSYEPDGTRLSRPFNLIVFCAK